MNTEYISRKWALFNILLTMIILHFNDYYYYCYYLFAMLNVENVSILFALLRFELTFSDLNAEVIVTYYYSLFSFFHLLLSCSLSLSVLNILLILFAQFLVENTVLFLQCIFIGWDTQDTTINNNQMHNVCHPKTE